MFAARGPPGRETRCASPVVVLELIRRGPSGARSRWGRGDPEAVEEGPDHLRVGDGRDDLQSTTAVTARECVDQQDPSHQLGPRQPSLSFGRACVFRSRVVWESDWGGWRCRVVGGAVWSVAVSAGTISGRHIAFGANSPWCRTRFLLGAGTSAHSFSRSSDGSKTTWVVPLDQGLFRRYDRRPSLRHDNRSWAIAGRAMYRQSFSKRACPPRRHLPWEGRTWPCR